VGCGGRIGGIRWGGGVGGGESLLWGGHVIVVVGVMWRGRGVGGRCFSREEGLQLGGGGLVYVSVGGC